jgi:uncharacterized protein (UPF0548 family)
MLLFRRPTAFRIQQFLETQVALSFSYPHVGATAGSPPAGYNVDHTRVLLGSGPDVFARAATALRQWQHFRLGWVELHSLDTAIEPGKAVAVLAHVCGVWFLNACRIVYVVEEQEPVTRFGFAYGTLPEHAESGEECFTVEWQRPEDSVWYNILAFSRPNQLLSRLGYPAVRRLQKRFARDSAAAMRRAVAP